MCHTVAVDTGRLTGFSQEMIWIRRWTRWETVSPTQCHVISCHIISCHIISCHVISCHIISCHVMSYHVISCHIMSYHVISCHVISYHVMSFHVISCHIMWCLTVHTPVANFDAWSSITKIGLTVRPLIAALTSLYISWYFHLRCSRQSIRNLLFDVRTGNLKHFCFTRFKLSIWLISHN